MYREIEKKSSEYFRKIEKKKLKKTKITRIKQSKNIERKIRIIANKFFESKQPSKKKLQITTAIDPNYSLLLNRLYENIRKKNPELYNRKLKKFRLKPPKFAREPRKTIILNYNEICESIGRPNEHLNFFIKSELETQSTIGSNGKLIIRGIFYRKDFEKVLKNYIEKFIKCRSCNGFNTRLRRNDTRLFTLKCKNCKAHRNIVSIKK